MSEKNKLEQALKICRNLLEVYDLAATPDKIIETIEKVNLILPLEKEEKEVLYDRISQTLGINQDAPRILDNNKGEPWVLDKWAENTEQRKFWRRYRDYLTDEKKFAPKVISRLDELTDNILDRLEKDSGKDY